MKTILSITALVLAAVLSAQAADEAGLQIALIPDIALHGRETTIHGLSLNLLCGENPQHGVTLGLVNIITDESAGLSLGAVTYAQSYSGVQLGLVNVSTDKGAGWQFGGFNYSGTMFKGLQSGLVNVATDCRGLQLGLINYTDKLQGLQIGALNCTTENRWFADMPNHLAAVFPIVNWSF